jgi:hypothetical protein
MSHQQTAQDLLELVDNANTIPSAVELVQSAIAHALLAQVDAMQEMTSELARANLQSRQQNRFRRTQ